MLTDLRRITGYRKFVVLTIQFAIVTQQDEKHSTWPLVRRVQGQK